MEACMELWLETLYVGTSRCMCLEMIMDSPYFSLTTPPLPYPPTPPPYPILFVPSFSPPLSCSLFLTSLFSAYLSHRLLLTPPLHPTLSTQCMGVWWDDRKTGGRGVSKRGQERRWERGGKEKGTRRTGWGQITHPSTLRQFPWWKKSIQDANRPNNFSINSWISVIYFRLST